MYRKICLYGAGKLAWSVCAGLSAAGTPPVAVFSRTEHSARSLASAYSVPRAGVFGSLLPKDCDLIIIAVPDSVIAATAELLAEKEESLIGKTFIHCSGILADDVLEQLKAHGASIASLQIIQTFPSISPVTFANVPALIQSDFPETLTKLYQLAVILGMKPSTISREQKQALHTASVFVCNFLTGNLFAAGIISGKKDNQEFSSLFYPILRQTVENAFKVGAQASLSGPVIRGDIVTIQKHLTVLHSLSPEIAPQVIDAYKTQTLLLLSMIEKEHTLTEAQSIIRAMLQKPNISF